MKENIKFRTVIPIFNIWNTDFETDGTWDTIEYKIRFIELTRKGIEINSIVDKTLADEIYKQVFLDSPIDIKGKDECQILVIDVTQPQTDNLKVASNSIELLKIEHAITLALHLGSNVGIYKKKSFTIRLLDNVPESGQISSNGYSTSIPQSNPNLIFHSGDGVCVIKDNAICNHIFKSLLQRDNKFESQANKLLDLALDYFITTFTLRNVEHAYLILMIVFEALFKEDESQNTYKAAKILAILIAKNKDERKEIQKKFTNNPNGFIDNRNKIAHGTLIDEQIISKQYPVLHRYIVRALIRILDLTIEHKIGDDYYKTLSSLT